MATRSLELSSLVRLTCHFHSLTPMLTPRPEGQKSTTQKLGDATRSGGDDAQNQGQGVLGSVQDGLSNAGQAVTDTFNSATGNKK